MSIRPMKLIAIVAAIVLAAPLAAALNGTYTCANGNPGNAFDYGDIGLFFNDLEAQGVGGPVTLNVYDDGGPLTATGTYALGVSQVGSITQATPVAGLSLASPLVIRAATGEHPVISGFTSLPNYSALGAALYLQSVSYTTIEGFTINNSPGFGITLDYLFASGWNVRITRCKFHGIGKGAFFYIGGSPSKLNACVFENNMVWDCVKTQPSN